jgi:ABC-type uncharacterized transport system auxiliary subunit
MDKEIAFMRTTMLACSSAALIVLAGCAGGPPKAETPTEMAKPGEMKPVLTEEAKKALAMAEAKAKEAKAKDALWTTADAALKKADEAARAGDSATVIKQAKIVEEHVGLGVGQLSYPSTNKF